jgi:putative sterol carrier protein
MSEVQLSPDDLFEHMPGQLVTEKAGAMNATIQFDLSGEQAGKWWVRIADGKAESGKGEAPSPPQLTVRADAGDWVKISLGKLDGTAAFMQGKLKITGDTGLAIRLQSLFRRSS